MAKRRKNRRLRGFFRELFALIFVLFFAAGLAVAIKTYLFSVTTIEGTSMAPTLQEGDRIMTLRWPRRLTEIHRGDLLEFKGPGEETYYIKRVVGLPGETVEIKNGNVLVDGIVLEESYTGGEATIFDEGHGLWKLNQKEYFVLGDNRRPFNSTDSRSFGPMKQGDIRGVVILRFYPFPRLKFFNTPSLQLGNGVTHP